MSYTESNWSGSTFGNEGYDNIDGQSLDLYEGQTEAAELIDWGAHGMESLHSPSEGFRVEQSSAPDLYESSIQPEELMNLGVPRLNRNNQS